MQRYELFFNLQTFGEFILFFFEKTGLRMGGDMRKPVTNTGIRMLFFQLLFEVNHLDGCNCALVSLVAKFATGTVFCLFHVVGGDEAINYRAP